MLFRHVLLISVPYIHVGVDLFSPLNDTGQDGCHAVGLPLEIVQHRALGVILREQQQAVYTTIIVVVLDGCGIVLSTDRVACISFDVCRSRDGSDDVRPGVVACKDPREKWECTEGAV